MAITTFHAWVQDGRPYKDCQPGVDMRDTLGRRYGMTVFSFPDETHLTANPPEDHTPFSHTPFPGTQPYPIGRAIDIMPDDDVCDWRALGEQIIADIDAKVAGTQAIAYVNYTDRDDDCHHVEYMPHKSVSSSTDTGHIHISFRTDFVASHVLADYDPVARLRGDDMTPAQEKLLKDIAWQVRHVPRPDGTRGLLTVAIALWAAKVAAQDKLIDHLATRPPVTPEVLADLRGATEAAANAEVAEILHDDLDTPMDEFAPPGNMEP